MRASRESRTPKFGMGFPDIQVERIELQVDA